MHAEAKQFSAEHNHHSAMNTVDAGYGDSSMKRLAEVWATAIASLCYCFLLPRRLQPGPVRLLSLLPVVALFTVLPLHLTAVNFIGATSFFLAWLANFKLLLFAFGLGPLSELTRDGHHISLLHFINFACLPIKTKRSTTPNHLTPSSLALKTLLFAVITPLKPQLHPSFSLLLTCVHMYLAVVLLLAVSAVLPRLLIGIQSAPQFNTPYLATSLQDFWGRRWNLMVSDILRQTVYNPMLQLCLPALGRPWGTAASTVATFVVSGLMHELIYYHITRVAPTWEVTSFFVLHGVATAAERAAKRKVGWRLHRAVSGPLALGLVTVTNVWLLSPQLLRNGVDKKAIKEYSMAVAFVRESFPFRWLH